MDTDHIQIPRIVKNERKVTCQQMFLLNFQKVFFNALGLGVHLLSNVRSVFFGSFQQKQIGALACSY